MPERASSGIAGDLLGITWQIAAAVAAPLFGAAWLSQNVTQDTGTQLAIVMAGLVVAGLGMYVVLRRYLERNPDRPVSEAAREAGRKWEAEVRETERKREMGEEQE
jgi:flagellar biosynthesis/type III secretory pathway M-ring protein FliF/YscJ